MKARVQWIRFGIVLALASSIAWALALSLAQTRQSERPSVQSVDQIEEESEGPFSGIDRDHALSDGSDKSRAFVYAPPPTPHLRGQQEDCMQCHAPVNDIRKKWRSIRPMAHPIFSQCKQCHVDRLRETIESFAESDFVGLGLPGSGSKAHAYAPPTVPHKVFMRDNCLSCHGPTGYSEFRTSHPERTQCLQCHAPESNMDYTRP